LTKILTVTVNYRAASLVAHHLPEVLAEQRTLPGSHLVIVDNCSPGDDATQLAALTTNHADVTFIPHDRNDGFSAGNNVGLRWARRHGLAFDALFLLNPDAWPQEGAYRRLADHLFSRPEIGLVGPRLLSEDGRLLRSAHRFHTALSEFEVMVRTTLVSRLLRTKSVAPPPRDTAHRAEWLSGAALMLRRDVVDMLGDMDEGYFLYFEETDYQYKAYRRGWEAWYVPEAVVRHQIGASTGMEESGRHREAMPDYWFRSRRRFFEQAYGRRHADLADQAWLLGARIYCLRQKLLGRDDLGVGATIDRFRANQGKLGSGRPEEA
jgi:GT2 family glycosyltransferase